MSKQEPTPKIIQVYNKKAKTTYLYEDIAYWDPVAKQGRHKRKGIGKLDTDGKPVYNEYYLNKLSQQDEDKDRIVSKTTLIGETLLIDKMIANTGLHTVLNKTLGKERAARLLQLARYSVCEGRPLCYAENWLNGRGYDGEALCSQRITDLLRSLDKDVQNTFFSQWMAKKAEDRSLIFDISSISSYARDNPYVERGYNRDREALEQINVALVSTYQSNTPLWCTELPGSMSDQAVLEYVCNHLDKLDVGKVGFLLDRGFYSEENIRNLTAKKHKFTMPVPSHIKWQKAFIDEHRSKLQRPANLIQKGGKDSIIYTLTKVHTTEYGRMWVHLYYDALKKERDVARLMDMLKKCQDDLEEGSLLKSREHYYERYFEIQETPVRGRKVILREDEVDAYINGYSGYWLLLSSHEKDGPKALSHYRMRNNIELHFDDLKNTLDCDRIRVHSADVMQGRIFINFLSMIIINELKRRVAAIPAKKRKYWNYRMMLGKVATYSKIHYRGKYKDVYTVPTKAQRLIFDLFDIKYQWKGKMINGDG
jgi:transposase